MKAYQFDGQGIYLGETTLQASPAEPGKFLNKPYTTTEEPLQEKEGYVVKFNGNKWEYVKDNRGEIYYCTETKSEKRITDLGQEIEPTWVKDKPGQFDKWDNKKKQWIEDIEAYNDNQKALRASAFSSEADTLFFKVQRGEATQKEYDAKVAEIRERYPYKEV